jgi:hypothetical protein
MRESTPVGAIRTEDTNTNQEFSKLRGTASAQLSDRDLLLVLEDQTIFLLGVVGFESLPGEGALQKVDQDVGDGLQVVTSTLVDPQVIIDGGVSRGPGQRAPISVRDMLKCFRVAISLRETKVDAINDVRALPSSDHKISLRKVRPSRESARPA